MDDSSERHQDPDRSHRGEDKAGRHPGCRDKEQEEKPPHQEPEGTLYHEYPNKAEEDSHDLATRIEVVDQ
jgi:hypothetical protein